MVNSFYALTFGLGLNQTKPYSAASNTNRLSPIALLFSLLCLLISAQPALANDAARAHLNIQQLENASFLDDKQLNSLSFSDLAKLNDANWRQLNDEYVFLDNKSQFSYLKIMISNPQNHHGEHYLELASNSLESASVYIFDTERQNIQLLYDVAGKNHPFNNRPINYRHLVYPVFLATNQTMTLLIKVEHHFDTKLSFEAWSESGFVDKLNRELIFFGMIYGTLLMIIIYNLFVYLSLREKNHLLFFLFGAFSGLFISMHEGHFAQFVAASSAWSKHMLLGCICAFMSFSFTFFAVYFLDLEKHSQFLYRCLLVSGSACAAFFILLGVSDENIIFSNLTLLVILALYSVAIWAGIRIWHRGITSAGFFSLAMFFSSFGLFLEYASQLEFTHYLPSTFSFSTLGYTAMLFVFAFALADKMRLLQQEKLDASLKLVKMTEEKAQSNLEIYKSRLSEVELENERQAVKLQLQAKSEFLSSVSHEIRTPMNSLLGMSELLRDTELNDRQVSYVDSISHSSNALLNVINDILDFSQFESGKMELDSRLFSLEKAIDECVNIFSLANTQENIKFIASVSADTPIQLKGDAEKIKQICLSLLNQSLNQSIESIYLQVSPTGKKSVNSIELAFNIDLYGENIEHDFFLSWLDEQAVQNDILLALSVSKQLIELMNGELTVEQLEADQNTDSEDENISAEHYTRISFTTRLLLPHSDENLLIEDRKALLKDRRALLSHSDPILGRTMCELMGAWGMRCKLANSPEEISKLLLNDNKPYQLLFIEKDQLNSEIQLALRQANVEHNNTTNVSLIGPKNFSLTKEEMKKQGISSIFNLPFTTGLLYQNILNNLGIETDDDDKQTENLQVLIAEDNTVNLLVLEGILKKQGIQSTSCVNGQEAIDSYKHTTPYFNLIFMDCEMPEIDGFEAAKAIREFEAQFEDRQASTIIGLSAHTAGDARQKAKLAGMNDFLSKPIKPEDIEQIIFQQQQSAPELEENNE